MVFVAILGDMAIHCHDRWDDRPVGSCNIRFWVDGCWRNLKRHADWHDYRHTPDLDWVDVGNQGVVLEFSGRFPEANKRF